MRSLALTGTPGTGKSTIAAILAARWRVGEVGEVAGRAAIPSRDGAGWNVDLARAARWMRADRTHRPDVVVGHLAHLLPIRDAIVLRCHPRELSDRLDRGQRGTRRERNENLVAEATDLILLEAIERRRRIWEIDTTGRSPASVANEVDRRLRHRGKPSYGRVDWLADPWVTEHLLDWSP